MKEKSCGESSAPGSKPTQISLNLDKMNKVEITKDGVKFSEYTKEDCIKECILDLVYYAQEYQQTRWWQFRKQYFIAAKIECRAKGLLNLITSNQNEDLSIPA